MGGKAGASLGELERRELRLRLWYIPYGYLDGQRLLSQHNEVHGLSTVILKGGRWGSIADKFRHSLQYLAEVHEKCVKELATRAEGNGRDTSHKSNFPRLEDLDPKFCSVPFKPTRQDLEMDVRQLREKWEKEGYFFGIGRLDLRKAEEKLGLPLGRTPDDCASQRDETRQFVRVHRTELKELGDLRLGPKLDLLAKLGKDPRRPYAAE